jgi:cell division cycle 14
MENPEETNTVEIISNRLYWISDRFPPSSKSSLHYFSIDSVSFTQHLVYRPYASDFGPLDLGKIYRFCAELNSMLSNPRFSNTTLYHYTSLNPAKRANAALLMGAFEILVLQRSAEEVCERFQHVPKFVPFCDASQNVSSFELLIGDCLKAVEKATRLGWFSFSSFDLRAYETHAQLEHGGLNWIIPGKVLAFVCPSSEQVSQGPVTPEKYVQIFGKLGVRSVVRLNNKTYEGNRFTRHGLKHHELYFIDGSVPSEEIVRQFVRVLEQEEPVAVHCKAGLGRTGTLIGCYAMKHFDFTAEEFIAWCRMCRPGSVLGPQQQFLCDAQEWCRRWGQSRGQPFDEPLVLKNRNNEEGFKARFGDYGQANRLTLKSNSPTMKQGTKVKTPLSPTFKVTRLEKASSEAGLKPKKPQFLS